MVYILENVSILSVAVKYVGEGVFSPSTTGEQFPIVLPDHVHLLGASRETTILDAEADVVKQSRVINIV